MQLNSLDNLCHRGRGSIPAIDEWWSEVEYQVSEQWTSILTQKHLVVSTMDKTLNQQSYLMYNTVINKGTKLLRA